MAVRPKPATAKGPLPPPSRSRPRPPYAGYVAQLERVMADPGEWYSIHTSDTRTYGYQMVKSFTGGKWALPAGTRVRDWEFQVESSTQTGTCEVFARYKGDVR